MDDAQLLIQDDNPLEIGCIQLSNYRLSAIAEEYLAMLQEALK